MHISSGYPRVVDPQVSVNPESQCHRYVFECCDKKHYALGSQKNANRIPTTLKQL
jgi:hypothetical protein